MNKKSRRKKEIEDMQSVPQRVEVAEPEFVDNWKRSTYGFILLFCALVIVVLSLAWQEVTYWPIQKYEPRVENGVVLGEVPKNYDYIEYLVSSTEEGYRWERKMLPWETPSYYLGAFLLYLSVRCFLPEKKKKRKVIDGNQGE